MSTTSLYPPWHEPSPAGRRSWIKGRGFHLVSGVPVQRWDRHRIEVFYWCLGLHLGRPGAQNPQGDLLGVVRDTGEDASDPFVRLYRTRSDIAYHCDAADVVGLLCLESAGEGGESRIASSVAIFNAILAERPDLAGRLFEPFPLDIRNEDSSGELRHIAVPPCRYSGQSLRTFYHSDYFRSAQRHPDVPRFTQDEESLLGLYEEIANDSGIRLDMRLRAWRYPMALEPLHRPCPQRVPETPGRRGRSGTSSALAFPRALAGFKAGPYGFRRSRDNRT